MLVVSNMTWDIYPHVFLCLQFRGFSKFVDSEFFNRRMCMQYLLFVTMK